ncbi:hypothetical protein RhiJN_08527 [Ceratobasidium sp. AG-Ba]|nr:hypothetical protein RhiJN_08527 [Ceratobasidium sp. AG-Ba]
MLCLNCQWGHGSGVGDDTGLDALQPGSYQAYLAGCGPVSNQTLTNATQTAVCKQGINIPNYLYTLFWDQGQWYYEYTRQTAQLQIQSGQNGSHCAAPPTSSMISATNVPSSTSSSLPPTVKDDNSSSTNLGAIIGGAVGGVGLLLIAALVFWFSRRRQTNNIIDLTDDEHEQSHPMAFEPYIDRPAAVAPADIQPFSVAPPSSTGHSYPDTSSDALFTAYVPPRRTGKAGMTDTSPPNRDETGPLMSDVGSSMSERHEDSAELTQAFGLDRSISGRLPPSYQAR